VKLARSKCLMKGFSPIVKRDHVEGNSALFSDLLSNDAEVGVRLALISAGRCVEDGMHTAVAELLYQLPSGALSKQNQ
jgi:hypothetical protein